MHGWKERLNHSEDADAVARWQIFRKASKELVWQQLELKYWAAVCTFYLEECIHGIVEM